MNCPHCGKEVDDGVNFCPNCGTKIQQTSQSGPLEEKDEFFDAPPVSEHEQRAAAHQQTAPVRVIRMNVLALIGFALSVLGLLFGASTWIGLIFIILISVAGLVCSSLGLVQCKRGANGKGFAIAGIVLGAVGIVVNVALMIVLILYPNFLDDLINYLLSFYTSAATY